MKIQKKDYPLRPVVSNIGNPTYYLSVFIAKLLKPLIAESSYNIKFSFELVKILPHTDISSLNSPKLISFNVVSLFTNVSLNLVTDYISHNYEVLNTTMPKDFLISIISFILDSSVFTYQNKYYLQTNIWVPYGISVIPNNR